MEYLGYFSSILIGIVLGIIGSGGSLLTIPVLVYLFSVDVVLATTYSLLIVGVTSAIGSINYFRHQMVNLKVATLFGLPSVLAVLLTRRLLLPVIPDPLGSIGSFVLQKDIFLLLLFAVLMIAAALGMISKPGRPNPGGSNRLPAFVVLQGLFVGMITGLVGAGGGFLIIPALVLWLRLPIKQAVGTSLVIIALNALIGFMGTHDTSGIDWPFLFLISGLAILGIFLGIIIAKKINPGILKPVFGWLVLSMGVYIITREIFLN